MVVKIDNRIESNASQPIEAEPRTFCGDTFGIEFKRSVQIMDSLVTLFRENQKMIDFIDAGCEYAGSLETLGEHDFALFGIGRITEMNEAVSAVRTPGEFAYYINAIRDFFGVE